MSDITPIRPDLAPAHREVEPVHVDILVPCHDKVDARFAYDLARLTSYTTSVMPDHVVLGQHMVQGTYVSEARRQLLEAVLNRSDWILWLDSDMSFPKETFVRLMSHDQDVVGINYAKRSQDEPDFVAIETINPGKKLRTAPDSAGLAEVEALGFGAVLMKGGALARLSEIPQPWFDMRYEDGQLVGEDVSFCKLLREELGLRLFVDQELSNFCSHIGQFEYRCPMVAAVQDAEAEEEA